MKIRIDSADGGPFGPHYRITDNARGVTVASHDDGLAIRYPLDFDKITAMVTHHMAQFEQGGEELLIDGHKIPAKVYSRACLDVLHGLLENHGITADYALIRDELCSKCLGLSTPAIEFVQNKPLTPEGVTHTEEPTS